MLKLITKITLGILVAGICFYWLSLQVDFELLGSYLKTIKFYSVIQGMLLITVAHVVFSKRLHNLIIEKVYFKLNQAVSMHFLGMLLNVILPWRLGDVFRVVAFKKYFKQDLSIMLPLTVSERVFDLGILIIFGSAVLFVIDLPIELHKTLNVLLIGLFILGLVSLVLLKKKNKLISWVKSKDSISIFRHGVKWLEGGLDALKTVAKPKMGLQLLFYSIVGWSLIILGFVCFFDAFDLSLSWPKVAAFTIFTHLGICIPSIPASIGLYHALAVFCLSLWAVDSNLALAVAIVTHISILVVQLTGGLIAAGSLTFSKMKAQPEVI